MAKTFNSGQILATRCTCLCTCERACFSVTVRDFAESVAPRVHSSKLYREVGSQLGTFSSQQQALNINATETTTLGLSLNVTKHILLGPSARSWTHSRGFTSVPLLPWDEGISLLIAPWGTASFVSDFIEPKSESLIISLGIVRILPL